MYLSSIGRALMARTRLLLLDEPSLGLAPSLAREIFQILTTINREGTTILLVEQNVKMALQIAHHGYVIESGRIALSDGARSLLENTSVRELYLGSSASLSPKGFKRYKQKKRWR